MVATFVLEMISKFVRMYECVYNLLISDVGTIPGDPPKIIAKYLCRNFFFYQKVSTYRKVTENHKKLTESHFEIVDFLLANVEHGRLISEIVLKILNFIIIHDFYDNVNFFKIILFKNY